MEKIAALVNRPAESEGTAPCYVLKVHGSADMASTVIDTLSQRAIGLAANITDCLRSLLHYGHWLVLVSRRDGGRVGVVQGSLLFSS